MQNTALYTYVNDAVQKSTQTQAINERIYNRNIPSSTLQPSFSMRPVQTKYTLFGVQDEHPNVDVPIKKEAIYNISTTFNPGNSQSPWSGFATNVNTESKLRNQFFSLQTAAQAVYIPDSSSDLYNQPNVGTKDDSKDIVQFPYLEKQETFDCHNPNSMNVGLHNFHNCTRQQLKNTTN